MRDSEGTFTSCADGFANNSYTCSDDMFASWERRQAGSSTLSRHVVPTALTP